MSFNFGSLDRSIFQVILGAMSEQIGEDVTPTASVRNSESERKISDPLPLPLCKARTLNKEACKNKAKPNLEYCYVHRGASLTKNSDCPICLEDFPEENSDENESIFLLACAHQLHYTCMEQLRTDSCPICRRRLTNIPKTLYKQICERKVHDASERSAEQLREAIENVDFSIMSGRRFQFFFRPVLLAATNSMRNAETSANIRADTTPQELWTEISPIEIFEDFMARQQLSVRPIFFNQTDPL